MIVGSNIGTPLPYLPFHMKLMMMVALLNVVLCYVLSVGAGRSSAARLTARRQRPSYVWLQSGGAPECCAPHKKPGMHSVIGVIAV